MLIYINYIYVIFTAMSDVYINIILAFRRWRQEDDIINSMPAGLIYKTKANSF